jgi:hypothetical protein
MIYSSFVVLHTEFLKRRLFYAIEEMVKMFIIVRLRQLVVFII